MKLKRIRVQNYRSVIDSGHFDLDDDKSILVGPNEAGKTALLQAIQQINPPADAKKLDPLRDYPRSQYINIKRGEVDPSETNVVEAEFVLDSADRALLPDFLQPATYVFTRYLDNSYTHFLRGVEEKPRFSELKKDFARLIAHVDKRYEPAEGEETKKPSDSFAECTSGFFDISFIEGKRASALDKWLDDIYHLIDEDNETEEARFDALKHKVALAEARNESVKALKDRIPVFVLFSNYFRVRPRIHLQQLAKRITNGTLDDERYDYGNVCLLKLLGLDAAELASKGQVADPNANDPNAMDAFSAQLDARQYELNSASVELSREIKEIWNPDEGKGEAARLRIIPDAQYLKVVVEDSMGVEVELDQRSEGFQWLVSFFVVFFAESQGEHSNAILLLDEPGMSLHALKQREFRKTLTRLSETNQTLYTTHSPFLVGPDELDRVRVVEMTSREEGTKVHTSVTANDPAALLPLQEALGYDLAQSLFTQKQNLVLEGLTDYWYLEAMANLLRESGDANLNEKIALVPANTAGKVVYFATILHAQKLKVAALLDSDTAGDTAAKQEVLIHTLGNKRILRSKDFLDTEVKAAEIEDILRETLVDVAKSELNWDISETATKQKTRPIVDIFEKEIKDFSKYRLAKTFVRWSRDHEASELSETERKQWTQLIDKINLALK